MAVAGRASEPAVVAHSRHGRLPAARGLVPRRPLFDRLSRVGPGEVVLLCAPAGSGKTALLRSWVESEGLADRVAWVSVELRRVAGELKERFRSPLRAKPVPHG